MEADKADRERGGRKAGGVVAVDAGVTKRKSCVYWLHAIPTRQVIAFCICIGFQSVYSIYGSPFTTLHRVLPPARLPTNP